MGVYQFLRNIEGNHPRELFQTKCSIYPARPQGCRIYPLARIFQLDESSEANDTTKQKLQLNNHNICPSVAFEKGKKKTTKEYLTENGAELFGERAFVKKFNDYLQKKVVLLRNLDEKTLNNYFNRLKEVFYYKIEYQDDIKSFYGLLEQEFNKFNTKIE